MERWEVYMAINTERDFVNKAAEEGGTHIVKDFPLGSGLAAIQNKVNVALHCWYGGVAPHKETMDEIRKIASICVLLGEQNGMPERK